MTETYKGFVITSTEDECRAKLHGIGGFANTTLAEFTAEDTDHAKHLIDGFWAQSDLWHGEGQYEQFAKSAEQFKAQS